MKERKNIDRLYQEKFKDFEATPQPRVWKEIAQELEKDKERKLILPIWYKIAGIAAVLALLLGGFWWQNNSGSGAAPGVVFEVEEFDRPEINIPAENNILKETRDVLNQIASENSAENAINSSRLGESKNNNAAFALNGNSGQNSTHSATGNTTKENTAIAESDAEKTSEEKEIYQNKTFLPGKLTDSTSVIVEKEDILKTEKDSLEKEAIASLDEISEELNENREDEKEIAAKPQNRLSLNTFAAPVVYNSLGGGNALDPQFAGNASNSNLTMAYGMNLAYQISEKIKIRSGISKVAMSYDIEDVMFSAAIMPNAISSINYSSNNNIQIQGNTIRENSSDISTSFAPQNAARPMIGKINQQFGFIEVPLEIEYKLIDKTIGLHLIGGGSSLFLDENSILLNSNNQNTRLGEANNINNFSFSTNIGLGVNYKLSESFNFNLEPIFKYQLNTFTGTRDVQPYYFGIYSGFSFKF